MGSVTPASGGSYGNERTCKPICSLRPATAAPYSEIAEARDRPDSDDRQVAIGIVGSATVGRARHLSASGRTRACLWAGAAALASEALAVAPPSPVVKAWQWPLAERRSVEAQQAGRRRGARYRFARPSAGRCRPSATAWPSWLRTTSPTSGECSSPAPPTTLLVLVRRRRDFRHGRRCCSASECERLGGANAGAGASVPDRQSRTAGIGRGRLLLDQEATLSELPGRTPATRRDLQR
jgi:hypothetical protein